MTSESSPRSLADEDSISPEISGKDVLSERALASIAAPTPYYIRVTWEWRNSKWSEDNPDGALLMSVSENTLSVDLMQERLKQVTDLPADLFGYGEAGGEMRLKKGIVRLLNSTFLPRTELDPNNVVISTGVAAILESLFFSILDAGEGMLIFAPFYPGYIFDAHFRARSKCVPVYLNFKGDLKKQLTEAKEMSESHGTLIRGLIVTNPNNPTGTIYPKTVLKDAAEWCADNQLHLVANEVYANTIFYNEPVAFHSLFEVGQELGRPELKERLHLIYGLSKDFCGSGLRIGSIYSESASLRHYISSCCWMSNSPALFQNQLAQVLEDSTFVEYFISKNKNRVEHNYQILSSTLTHTNFTLITVTSDSLVIANISFVRPQGGIFVWLDLRKSLPTPDYESEQRLCERLAEAGLLLSPGESFYASEPGFFRICYATVAPAAIPVAVARLQTVLCMPPVPLDT